MSLVSCDGASECMQSHLVRNRDVVFLDFK